MVNFETRLAEYVRALAVFRNTHELPGELFVAPDHVAIKCADSADYEAELGLWLPKAAETQYVRMNGRRMASARLLGPLSVGSLGQVEWLEIMEPRPEKVGMGPVGVDHIEFIFGDLGAAVRILGARGIPYKRQENPSSRWLSIMANGHEFKLTSTSLADVVAAELAAGVTISLSA